MSPIGRSTCIKCNAIVKQQSTNKNPIDIIHLMATRIQRTKKEMGQKPRNQKFTFKKPVSEGIPWKKFSEIEIQAILKHHFEILGFDVIWRHKHDSANEKGIDLECIRKADKKKIIIAVKIKPLKNDIAQVLELTNSRADQKIYVHINGTAQSFRDLSEQYGSDIEFWDPNKLEEKLEESNLTLILKINNSCTSNAIHDITKILEKTINTIPKQEFPQPTAEVMETLWGMKNRAVSVNKCANLNNNQVLDLVLWCHDHISSALDSLLDGFKSQSSDMKAIIYHTHKVTSVRSNWRNLKFFDLGLIPGNVESMIGETSVTLTDNDIDLHDEIPKEKIDDNTSTQIFKNAAGEFCAIAIWADALEDTVDFIHEGCMNRIFLPSPQKVKTDKMKEIQRRAREKKFTLPI